MRAVAVVLVLVLVQGCIYSMGNLEHGKDGYKNYPTSIEAEQARRHRRRRHALIAAPLEIVGGIAIAALALYAPSSGSDATTTTGALKDAGKEILGRLLLAAAGGGIAISGVGDGVLAAIDPATSSPIIRDDKLVPADEIDTIDPPSTPRLGIHIGNMLSTDGIGMDAGVGFAHWISSTIRLRHSASAELTLPWGSADRRLLVSAESMIERAFGREQAGLFPTHSLGMYVSAGWAAIEDRPDAPVLRAGISIGLHRYSYRIGTTFMAGEHRPSIDLGLRTEIRTD